MLLPRIITNAVYDEAFFDHGRHGKHGTSIMKLNQHDGKSSNDDKKAPQVEAQVFVKIRAIRGKRRRQQPKQS